MVEAVAPPKISSPAQEFAEWKRETGIYDTTLSQCQEFAAWKQKMELYGTSLLDLWPYYEGCLAYIKQEKHCKYYI